MMMAQFTGQALGPGFMPVALGVGETQVVSVNRMEQSTARFLNTIDRLERRINDLEGGAEPATNVEESVARKPVVLTPEAADASAETPEPMAEMEASMTRVKSEQAEREARLALLLGKGQALLNLQQADTALAC